MSDEDSLTINSQEFPYANTGESIEEEEESSKVSLDSEDFEEPRYLTYEEATKCLCTLGKNDSGLKYSYLMMNASDRGLTDISIIPTFRNIVYVNVSGNKLTPSSLEVLFTMTYLLMLQADRNKISSAVMEPMLYLQVLTLNRNGISETVGISHRLLECLELNYNKISEVSLHPYVLENLRILELRGNLLKTTNGIFFPSLVALYVAENNITRVEGFDTLINLRILHARDNEISLLDGFSSSCVKLRYINLRNNKIADLSEISKLEKLANLETLIVSENPIGTRITDDNEGAGSDENWYRLKLITIIPTLKRINKDPVLREEREEAQEMRQRILKSGPSFADVNNDDLKSGTSSK